jgi:hypothetical protein
MTEIPKNILEAVISPSFVAGDITLRKDSDRGCAPPHIANVARRKLRGFCVVNQRLGFVNLGRSSPIGARSFHSPQKV